MEELIKQQETLILEFGNLYKLTGNEDFLLLKYKHLSKLLELKEV